MLKSFYTLLLIFIGIYSFAQEIDATRYAEDFDAAYTAYPNIPNGLLEGVAFAQTRIRHLAGNNAGCSGIPQVKGVMGLTENGQGYFNDNLNYISSLSGYTINDIKTKSGVNIMAYAAAYSKIMDRKSVATEDFQGHDQILKTLSEIPWSKNAASDFALSCFTYEVFQFMNNETYQLLFDLPNHEINLGAIYGAENYGILSSETVFISDDEVIDDGLRKFKKMNRSDEYGPAIWNAAPPCNYSSRAGVSISAVTVHTIQGSYAGAISWAQNCVSNVSYHYVARSSDGQITQMLLEEDKGWHVGSANPYTIGIEHEGYVDDPVWYTEAMYVGSANLVRDITESGYGINPLRTYKGPATAATLTLGACTKIKGHQHFPGASHTDPGINWDWEHYYQLINNDPETTVYTAPTGVLFDSGGAADNYDDDERFLYLIQPADAVSITLNIISFSLELDWDYLYVYDGADLDAPLIGEYTGEEIPDIITASGGSVLVEFRSDCNTNYDGWEIEWTSIVGDGEGDDLAPYTEVVLEDDWYTMDFLTGFTDLDDTGGSGVDYQFYQVIDYNGDEWRANDNRGFFSDNFDDVIHPDWTTETGTWIISDNTLQQTDEAIYNTNIHADLNQDDADNFLYHWSGRMSGIGGDKRAGLHFMCDDPTLVNRGNSYFVWFREDDDKIQFYKVVDDEFTLAEEADYSFSADTWYDFKVVYNKVSGEVYVWINNVLAITWIDDSPYTEGNSVSFRSGSSVYNVNNFKVYRNRAEEELILVGPTGDARYQNEDSYSPAAKVKSIVIDSASNVSTIAAQLADIDWTPPLSIPYLNDGEAADIATTTSNTELEANWGASSDPNSGLARYWYAIGTSAGATDVVDWTDNWYADTVLHTGLSLTLGETYYFAVMAENGAGLLSDTIYSNGQLLIEPTEEPVAEFIADHTNLCGLDSIQLENGSTDALSYEWFMPGGTPDYSTEVNPYVQFPITGIYPVTLVATGPGGEDTLVQNIFVELDDAPIALFEPSVYVVLLDDGLVTFENNSLNADGYYWNFGDGTFSADESPWHTYEAVGDFLVSLIAINGDCPNDTSDATIKVREADGISELDEFQLSLYPNPASEFIEVNTTIVSQESFAMVLYDAQGRQVLSQSNLNFATNKRVSIAHLAKGVYHVKLQVGELVFTEKLVVE
jgi:PKD repeat protein